MFCSYYPRSFQFLVNSTVFGSVRNVGYLIVPISRDAVQPFGECKKTASVRSEKCFRELFNDSRSARSNYLRDPQVIRSVKAERDWTIGRCLSRRVTRFRKVLVCFRDWTYLLMISTNFCQEDKILIKQNRPKN